MSPKQKRFFEFISKDSVVIPTTARTLEAYNRVKLEFHHSVICTHGALILKPNGEIDQGWAKKMREGQLNYQSRLQELKETCIADTNDFAGNIRIGPTKEFGASYFLSCKHLYNDEEALHEYAARVQSKLSKDYWTHLHGNDFSILPMYFSKRKAMEYVLTNHFPDHELTIGVGDSISDLDFMQACDFLVIPGSSQIAHSLG